MSDKITISLTPYDALTILTFLCEFKEDMQHPKLSALKEAVENYHSECVKFASEENMQEAILQREVNRLIDKDV